MLQYFAYGLGIHSNLALPEFIPQNTACDVTVTLQPPGPAPETWPEMRQYLKISPQETIVAIRDIGLFHIREGREIFVTPFPESDERLIQLCIAGSIMATLLYQRGFPLLLHASAIALNNQVVCILGNSGDGKSSTAAALLARGHRIISDDVVPIQITPSAVHVVSAYPQIKISPEIATAFGYPLEQLSFLHPRLGEYAYRSLTQFDATPAPLSRIYVLNNSDTLSIEKLPPQTAMVEMIRHSYGLQPLGPALDRALHLSTCTQLLNHVSVCRLNRPRSIPLLAEVVRCIESDVLQTVSAS